MSYTDPDLVSAYLKRDLSNNEQLTLSLLIPAIQQTIDKYCNMTFLEVAETTRYYDGGTESIDIEACTEISAVTSLNDDRTDSYAYVENTEYLAYPLNENVKREIRRRGGCFPHGEQRMAVTAKFSGFDSGVPQAIQTVATMLAASALQSAQNTGSGIKSESLEGHSITYQDASQTVDELFEATPMVKTVLQQFRDLAIG